MEGFELESPLAVTMGRLLGILFLICKMGGINGIIWGLSEIRWLKPRAHTWGARSALAVVLGSARGRRCEQEPLRFSCD